MISLSWPSRAGAGVRRSAVSVDGRAVAFEDPSEIYPPAMAPGLFQVVEVVAEYANGGVARDQIGVGGPVLGETSAPVTAVPFMVSDPEAEPTAGGVAARASGSDEPVRVLGVERGDAEIVFVRDASAASAVERIAPGRGSMGALSGARDAQAARAIHAVPILADEWVRVLHPGAPVRRGRVLDAQLASVPLVSDLEGNFGLAWHLKNLDGLDYELAGRWLSDAVAIAGGRAAYGSRRRATVLLLAGDSVDEGSLLDPARAREYLEALGVPLHAWYLGKPAKAPDGWGATVGVRGVPAMEQALAGLRAALERQRIAWVEGVHLPGEIEVELLESTTPTGSAAR
jgi:hypothetical protein